MARLIGHAPDGGQGWHITFDIMNPLPVDREYDNIRISRS